MIELVVLCDPDGAAVGTAPKTQIHHGDTPLHLAFSCYVFDRDRRTLVTRRATDKAVFPGVRTNSCCGHPAPGESLTEAVRRRLREELGLSVGQIDLVLPTFHYRATAADGTVENELCPVYRVVVDEVADGVVDGVRLRPDEREVAAAWWEPWHRLVADLDDVTPHTPDPLSPWAAAQMRRLAVLGADPLAWPLGDPADLPSAACP